MLRHLHQSAFPRLLTVFTMLAWGLSASAQQTYTVFPAKQQPAGSSTAMAQPTQHKVTLIVSDSTIEYVVNELARQASLQPNFIDDPVLAKRVTIHVVDVNVMDALATVLKGTGLVAKLTSDGATVVIRKRTPGSSAAHTKADSNGVVAGRVTDSASGQGLVGATVKVQGSDFSTITSDSGRFTLKGVPPSGAVLTVRLFGFKPATHAVTVADSGRTPVRITLIPVATVLLGW